MIFPAKTKDGNLRLIDRSAFEAYLREICQDSNWVPIVLRIEHNLERVRSLEQNDTLHGLLRKILKVLISRGFDELTVVSLKNWFSGKFISDLIVSPLTGLEEAIVRGSSELNIKEFNMYIANIGRFALQEMLIERESLEPYIDKCDF